MSTAATAIRSARVYLNDLNGITWSDTLLMPLLQEAHGELVQELDRHNSSTLKIQTAPITVNAGVTTLPSQPANILNPISMSEGDVGADLSLFTEMIPVSFIPMEEKDYLLLYWGWIGETIKFLGATTNRDVILRYEGYLTTPQMLNDPLGVIFAERFLGPRIASLAFSTIGRDSKTWSDLAASNLYKIVQAQVNGRQTPVQRRGYRMNRRGSPTSSPIVR